MKVQCYASVVLACFGLVLPASAMAPRAATPSVEQALRLAPIQKDVDYSRPEGEEVAKCKMTAQKAEGAVGWVVEDANGTLLRRFVDTNADNRVDQWSYYKDGLEVYRDTDSNFNGKADQYRWYHTAGSRWGVDKDEDTKIDYWKFISAEEVSAEVVAALAEGDVDRFLRVALSPSELKSLGLGPSKTKELAAKIEKLDAKFRELAGKQKAIAGGAKWLQFSGTRPGIVPAHTNGSTQDLQVYENAVAIVQTGSGHAQVQIGTLVLGAYGWRTIDVPVPAAEGQTEVASGFFFHAAPAERAKVAAGAAPNEEVQKLMAEIEKLETAVAQAASAEEKAKLHARKADLLEQIADRSKGEERAMWQRQLADMIGAAVQSGAYPEGSKRLQALFDKLQKGGEAKAMVAHVRFVQIMAKFSVAMQDKKADFLAVQNQWLKDLERFVADYPESPDAADAMLQLATAQEFAGQEEEAGKWYARIVKDFPNSPLAKRAAGARARLGSVGSVISIQGKGLNGDTVDVAKYRGKAVLVQYWATSCEPCKADMAVLKDLLAKYGSTGFAVIGVNLDPSAKEVGDFLSQQRVSWPQIHEEGGFDSRPANELGIFTLPTMILIDAQGRVVNRNIRVAEIDRELKRLLGITKGDEAPEAGRKQDKAETRPNASVR